MYNGKKTLSNKALLTEWELIQAAQRNPARFRPLYEKYYEAIFRYVLSRTGDEQATADICSQVFLKVLQRLDSYTYKGVPFSAWLFRIAGNETAQYYRDQSKKRVVSLDQSAAFDLLDELEEEPLEENLLAQIKRALNCLKENELKLIELRFFEKRQFKEIADILQITENNAKVKTYRLLGKMKKELLANPIL